MELFRIHKTIPFMKYSKILNAISFISFFIAIGLLVVRGLAFSIEFTGGLVMEVNYPDAVPVQELRVDLEKATGGEVQVVNFGTARDAQIRLPLKGNKTSAQMSEEVMKVIHEKAPEAQLRRTEFVGPQVGEELATDGLTALLLVIVGIMIYLAFRMEVRCCGHYCEYARRFPGARCLLAVPVGILSAGSGGRSCGFGLLGQRVRDYFRPLP